MGLLPFSYKSTRQHTAYIVNMLCGKLFYFFFDKLPHFKFIFSIGKNKQICVWDHQFHPAASTPYLDKDSWRLYSLPKSMLFDFRVLTKSN